MRTRATNGSTNVETRARGFDPATAGLMTFGGPARRRDFDATLEKNRQGLQGRR
jgi:hypothetical protein